MRYICLLQLFVILLFLYLNIGRYSTPMAVPVCGITRPTTLSLYSCSHALAACRDGGITKQPHDINKQFVVLTTHSYKINKQIVVTVDRPNSLY